MLFTSMHKKTYNEGWKIILAPVPLNFSRLSMDLLMKNSWSIFYKHGEAVFSYMYF